MMGPMPRDLAREMVEEWEAELNKMDFARADCVAVWINGVLAMEFLGVGAVDGDLKMWAETVSAAWPDQGSPDIPRIEKALGLREEVESKLLRMIASVRCCAGLPSL